MNYITMREFGKWGRWGNQLLQYAFLKSYARRYDCQLQLPPWVGQEIFGFTDPPVTVDLPPRLEQTDHLQQAIPPAGTEYVNTDFRGYAQYHTSYYRPHKCFIRSLFRPVASVVDRLSGPAFRLRAAGRTTVGLHLRRGDYGRLIFPVTPLGWYLEWLAKHWDSLDDPVLFVATEDVSLLAELGEYRPLTASVLGVELSEEPCAYYQYLAADRQSRDPVQMDFFPDWYLLSGCDVLLAPNSSFSFTAAMLGSCRKFYRSSLPAGGFLELDQWDSYPLQHDKAEDYRHLPGVCLDETPYWRRLPDGTFEEKI